MRHRELPHTWILLINVWLKFLGKKLEREEFNLDLLQQAVLQWSRACFQLLHRLALRIDGMKQERGANPIKEAQKIESIYTSPACKSDLLGC